MSHFTVYGRPGCGYCVAATRLLESQGLAFEYIDIFQSGVNQSQLEQKVGQPVRTVPQILHGDNYVGGYRELVPYLKSIDTA